MEGGAIAVSDSVKLPANPTAGSIELIALGGNGFTAPQAAYAVQIQLASDASGGASDLKIEMDDRYTTFIAYMQCTVSVAASEVANRLSVQATTFDVIHNTEPCDFAGAGLSVASVSKRWVPPTRLLNPGAPGQQLIQSQIPNVNGETHFFNAYLLLFDIRVRETTPYYVIMANRAHGE